MGSWTNEYIITLKNYNDLDQFYQDMETEGTNLEFVPSRSVECTERRPISRNTHYRLTNSEVRILKNDPRIESIIYNKLYLNEKHLFYEQTNNWDRSSNISLGEKNWGLYRMQLEENDGSWGSDIGDPIRNASIKINGTGKNIDIIVVDQILYPDHAEFSGRATQYDWFRQHDVAVRGDGARISSISRSFNNAVITTIAPHRLRNNSIIDIICSTDESFTSLSTTITVIDPIRFQYSNTGIDVAESTPATGTWRGVYQYPSYNLINNHATAVAGVIAGSTQGWARNSNIYNLRNDSEGLFAGEYTPPDLLIDYIRAFHNAKPINPETGRRNPTLVNNSWGFVRSRLSTSLNDYTLNLSISRLNYRGTYVTPAGAPIDTGISGVFSPFARVEPFPTVEEGNAFNVTTSEGAATITPITFTDTNGVGLTSLGAPPSSASGGIDQNDDASWAVSLPFSIEYLGSPYQNNIYFSSNSAIFFGLGSPYNSTLLGNNVPAANKMYLSAGDRNVENILTGSFGTSPNRTFVVRFEGWDGAYSSIYEPENNLIWEVVFYEATPARIDVRFIKNAAFRPEFTLNELLDYGCFVGGDPIPVRDPSMDADILDAINDGIIFVGAAGNVGTYVDTPTGQDYNNHIVENGEFIYYHRGSSPANSHPDLICVGALDSTSSETKTETSNTGPGVDLYAPGKNIITSVFNGTGTIGDTLDDNGELYQKWSGTSVAAAQVTGLLALVLELYPNMTQADAKQYILNYAKENLITDTNGSYLDQTSLQGGNNKIAYYYKERLDTGTLIPKTRQWIRPSTGQLYPRPVIRKK
jgi:hypothetical protein